MAKLTSLRERKESLEQERDTSASKAIHLNARIKVLRPGSRESSISINSISKVSVRTNLVAEPELSRNTSI